MQLFDFNGFKVRVFGTSENPLFAALDICNVLETPNVSQACNRLDEDQKSTIILNDGTQGNPYLLCVTESGFYDLVLKSRKKQAKVFRKWVTSDVLPTIRKTGLYADPSRFSEEEYQRIQQVVIDKNNRIAQLEGEAAVKMELLQAQEVHWTDRKNRRSSAIDLADRGKFTIELTGSFDRSIKLKDSVRVWMESKYSRTGSGKNAKWRAVYSLKHEFESNIGYVTFGVLTLWLEEWGWNLRPYSTLTLDGTHGYEVFVCLR